MKTISKIMIVLVVMLSSTITKAQINNAKTDNVKVFGNCGMCKKNIEKAGNVDNVAQVNWDKETKMAVVNYDSKKTSLDEILKRIAASGYDSDAFQASEASYKKLHQCCQYDRSDKGKKCCKKGSDHKCKKS
jgi:copper chaperone CopZ